MFLRTLATNNFGQKDTNCDVKQLNLFNFD